jgi:salicylate hydroxylase
MAEPAPILIAGAGIGGLALALALARIGRRSVVLEQREALAGEGAGIQLGPNGVRVLQRLGLAEALRPAAGEPDALEVRDAGSARLLARLPLGDWLRARHGAPYWAVHRADLHAALLDAAMAEPSITMRSGFAFASAAEKDGAIDVRSANEDTASGRALVGADGLWSMVRGVVTPGIVPQFVGATATRTVIPAAGAGALAGDDIGLSLGAGINVVHYPVRGGAEIAVVIIAAESWRATGWDLEADRPALAAHLGRLHASLAGPLAAATSWRKWALHELPALPRWSVGRTTLIGDAAHPMLPHLAQGGVLALEDALVLADCVRTHGDDEAQAFRSFEAMRRARAARVQAASRRNGRVYHLAPPLAWARNAVLRVATGTRMMASYDWLYGWQPPDMKR